MVFTNNFNAIEKSSSEDNLPSPQTTKETPSEDNLPNPQTIKNPPSNEDLRNGSKNGIIRTGLTDGELEVSSPGDVQWKSVLQSIATDLPQRKRQKRVHRTPIRGGEVEQAMEGRCCVCDGSGKIMSWPKCIRCLHNSCGFCVVQPYEASVKGETKPGPVGISKMREHSGHVVLHLEDIERDFSEEASEEIREVQAAIHQLNAAIEKLGDRIGS